MACAGANIVGTFIVCHKMSPSLSGCTVLVTGASAGIGAATAVHFAKFGLNNDLSDFHADDDDSVILMPMKDSISKAAVSHWWREVRTL